MNHVPSPFRNVINPWQSPKEIRRAVAFIESMFKWIEASETCQSELLQSSGPDRDWSMPR